MTLYDSIIPCFGSRLTVNLMPEARRYRVFPLGTFHYFDWQKSDQVGISIGTCPQIVSSETAQIGLTVDGITRMLPYDAGETFADLRQHITPLTTVLYAADPALPVEATFTFRSAFYPQSFELSCPPGYCLEVEVRNKSSAPVSGEVFFELPLTQAEQTRDGLRSITPIEFPDGIDHSGIEDLTFEQIISGQNARINGTRLTVPVDLQAGEVARLRFYHVGYIAQPTLNQQGNLLRFGYTTLWKNASEVLSFCQMHYADLVRKGRLFESTVMDATVPAELKAILSSAFKGVACNSWWAENDWFSVMEIGAYHSTLDVDYQLALFFFQYWPELIGRMLNQWAAYYQSGSGYMAHDVGQHLEATGNRYGGPGSAMKVEENCNYILLLHHYWRVTRDTSVLDHKEGILRELVEFLIAADTTGSGLPNRYADNTNDWGSGLITASEEQSYHGVRLIAAYTAARELAEYYGLPDLQVRFRPLVRKINATMGSGWLGDHYPISFSDPPSFQHYSMWTVHGLLYALRSGMELDINIDKLRTDLISSTRRTMREHGCVHSTLDVRGWLTQNLWRDCIAAYLRVDMTDNLRRYMGHGEYVSYEDTTILEVANELMVVPGAVAGHQYAGELHNFPMVDGHPRPACGFGLLYALAGVQFDRIESQLSFLPVIYPLRIALTHLADWENERIPWVRFERSIPNQDRGPEPQTIRYHIEGSFDLSKWHPHLREE